MLRIIGSKLGWAICPTRFGLPRTAHNLRCSISSTSTSAPFPSPPSEIPLDLHSLDIKWQERWQHAIQQVHKKVEVGDAKEKKYILPMFPYPSGDLHLGHLRVYTISDVLARFQRMRGYDVLHPIGWDAFGLPAENAAIERGIHPKQWTEQNIAKMKTQLEGMNGHWNWDREFATCDPEFYKHTQRLFLLLYENGLAYQAEALVNYDPVDKTVLANEQVDTNGFSWRSGAKVEKKLLKQWFFKISQFRQELLDDLDILSKTGAWPERVVTMQKHWLGKSTGCQITFGTRFQDQRKNEAIEVFTTRPDTLYGVQYIALAPTHPIVQELSKTDVELQLFLDTLPSLPQDSKAGYMLPQIQAINPLSSENETPDATKELLPVFVAPYVLGDYGDGAVMGVPGHDIRDNHFWAVNGLNKPVRKVLQLDPRQPDTQEGPFVHAGWLNSNSGPLAGMRSADAIRRLTTLLSSKGLGATVEKWRLRDWLISRQRYWGTPIPIIHCGSCGPVPVPDDQLPVVLPTASNHWGQGKAGNPLESEHEWIHTTCPKCSSPAKRDTDTMDTFVDSSWYFMRFIDAKNGALPFSPDLADKMLPVDLYVGGVEHAILHLLYARFISKFIATTGLWSSTNKGEPFKKVLTQGMVHGKTFSDPSSGRFLKPNEVDLCVPSKPVVVASGVNATITFEKMSKSKYNGVDPGTCIAKYGADATRAHILFQAPVSEVLLWDEEKILGITRWLRRIHEHLLAKKASFSLVQRAASYSGMQATDMKDKYISMTTPKTLLTTDWHAASNHKLNIDWRSPSAMTDSSFAALLVQSHPPKCLLEENIIPVQQRLWQEVQKKIGSITQSYGETHSLNTVVSDLMILTNANITYAQAVAEQDSLFNDNSDSVSYRALTHADFISWHAWKALIQMMAPITPAFAEECWEILHPSSVERRDYAFPKPIDWLITRFGARAVISRMYKVPTPSIFATRFPEVDGSLELISFKEMKCAVQIDGKLKFVVEIGVPREGMTQNQLTDWVVGQILKTAEGKRKLVGAMDVKKAKKVIVVKKGKTVNFVM